MAEDRPKSYNWPVLFLFVIVFMAIGGNIIVCLAVLYERRLRNTFNYFLVSLATSDMLSATLVMPVTIIKAFVDFDVPHMMCMIWYALDVLFTSSTITHLTMISVDRYRALKSPLKYGATKRTKHTLLKIAIVWILAFCVAGPLFVLSMYDTRKDHVAYKGCGPESPTFVITATVISFYLPLLIMTIMYILTVAALHKQGRAQKLMQKMQHSKKFYGSASKDNITYCNSMHSDLGSAVCVSVSPSIDRCSGFITEELPSGHTSNVIIDNSTSPENSNTPLLKPKCPKPTTLSNRNTLKMSQNENIPLKEMSLLSPLNQPVSSNGALYANNNHQNSNSQDNVPKALASYNTSECGESLVSNSTSSPTNDACNIYNNKQIPTPNVSIKVSNSIGSKLKSKLHHKRRRKSRKSYSSVEKSRKAVQVLGVLFAVFLLCYFPFFLTYLIKGTCVSECPFHISDTLLTVFEWMGYSGSMINPIIYHIFNKEFRRSFYRLIKCKPRKK